MTLLDLDSWTTEYEACDRLSRDIQAQIVQRNAEPVQSEKYARVSAIIRLRLKQFTNELQQLSVHIKDVPLTIAEEERRRRQIETLQSKLIQLQTQFANANGAASISRTQLFHQTGNSLWDDDDSDDDQLMRPTRAAGAAADEPYTVEKLRQKQTQILNDQDEGLENLSKIISRQKQLAIRIGDEVEIQNDIIDDLADDMERTDLRITHETRNVRQVSDSDSGTCTYWIIIGGLFAAIVVVAIL